MFTSCLLQELQNTDRGISRQFLKWLQRKIVLVQARKWLFLTRADMRKFSQFSQRQNRIKVKGGSSDHYWPCRSEEVSWTLTQANFCCAFRFGMTVNNASNLLFTILLYTIVLCGLGDKKDVNTEEYSHKLTSICIQRRVIHDTSCKLIDRASLISTSMNGFLWKGQRSTTRMVRQG